MDLGYFADRNEIAESECTITSNIAWEATGPLSSLKTTPVIDEAVSTALGTLGAPVTIDILFDNPTYINYAGLLYTNLRQSSFRRLDVYEDAAGTELLYSTIDSNGRDGRIIPPLYDPATLRAGSSNQMRGDLDSRDFRLYPTNIHVIVELSRARLLRWSLWGDAYQPDDSDDTAYRIGLAWAGDGISMYRDVGSGDGIKFNDQVITSPDGGTWVEAGITKRTASLDQGMTERETRDALFDSAHRAGKRKPLIWLPDVADAADCFRNGGLFRRTNDHENKYISPFYTSGGIALEEWKE